MIYLEEKNWIKPLFGDEDGWKLIPDILEWLSCLEYDYVEIYKPWWISSHRGPKAL